MWARKDFNVESVKCQISIFFNNEKRYLLFSLQNVKIYIFLMLQNYLFWLLLYHKFPRIFLIMSHFIYIKSTGTLEEGSKFKGKQWYCTCQKYIHLFRKEVLTLLNIRQPICNFKFDWNHKYLINIYPVNRVRYLLYLPLNTSIKNKVYQSTWTL